MIDLRLSNSMLSPSSSVSKGKLQQNLWQQDTSTAAIETKGGWLLVENHA
jgi:hypothetical protein